MERAIYAALARLLLPRRMRERLGDDLLRCHDDVMAEASRSGRRLRVWVGEVVALLRASAASRSGGGPTSPPRGAGTGRGSGASGRGSGGANRPRHAAAVTDDLRHALRSLLRTPASTTFVVLMLGGGLGAAITVYSAVRHTLIHPLPYEGADRFVSLWRTAHDSRLLQPPTVEEVDAWGGQADMVEGVLKMSGTQKTLTGRGEPESLYTVRISEDYFRTLGIAPVLGRTFTAEELADDATRSLLLGYDLWRNRFGSDPAVLGTSVSLDGEPWTVIGVGPRDAPPPTGFPEDARFWLPLTPSARVLNTVAILRAGVSLEAFQERIDTLVARANAEAATPSPFGGTATRAQQMSGTRLRGALTTLAVAVGLMLLIACLNASALLVNRADRRRHETAVRVALGAGRGRIVRQHLVESLLLATAAGLAGVALAAAGLQLVQVLRPDNLSLLDRASLDGPVIGFSLALTALTGVAFGLLPAWQAASRRALDALRRGRRGGQGDRATQRMRWGLVVGEVALSFALLVGGGLLARTMLSLNRVEVGYRPEGVLVAHVRLPAWSFPEGADRAAAWERVLEVSRGITGVESATLATGVPPSSGIFVGTLEVEGREIPEDERESHFFGNAVGPAYFTVLDQRVVAGRGFTDDEARDEAPVYVLSESTARALWPDGDVAASVGRRMRLGDGDWRTVVGVVSDVPATGLTADRSTRQLYIPIYREAGSANVVLRVAGDARDTRAVIPALVERLRIVAPDAPIEINEAVALLGESVAMQRFTARLLTLLAALAALLASAGMYGVVAETVGRRTQEIGIRISLGAHGGAVVWMVLKAGALALALGVTLGVGLSLASARVIESQLFGVQPGDLPTFIAAGLTLSVAVLVATWLPARRAARIDPVRAMAAE